MKHTLSPGGALSEFLFKNLVFYILGPIKLLPLFGFLGAMTFLKTIE